MGNCRSRREKEKRTSKVRATSLNEDEQSKELRNNGDDNTQPKKEGV